MCINSHAFSKSVNDVSCHTFAVFALSTLLRLMASDVVMSPPSRRYGCQTQMPSKVHCSPSSFWGIRKACWPCRPSTMTIRKSWWRTRRAADFSNALLTVAPFGFRKELNVTVIMPCTWSDRRPRNDCMRDVQCAAYTSRGR